jgi:hypothetical protein
VHSVKQMESVLCVPPSEVIAVNCGSKSLCGVQSPPFSHMQLLCDATASLVSALCLARREREPAAAGLGFGLHAVLFPCFAATPAPSWTVDLAREGWRCDGLVHSARAAQWLELRERVLELRYQTRRRSLWKRQGCAARLF